MGRKQLWRVPIWVATALFSAWVADLYVPGFHIDGSLNTRLIVGGVVAALSAAAGMATTLVLVLPISALMMIGATTRMLLDAEPPKAKLVPHPVAKALGSAVIFALFTAVILPLSSFLAVRACRVVGMPVELTGGWPAYFTVGLVLYAVRISAQSLLAPRITNKRVRPWVAARLALLACVVVLWLAVELTDSVHLGAPTGRHVLFDILVLAAMLDALRFTVSDRWGTVTQAPVDVVAVWVLAWSSGWLVNPLEFSGPWPLVLTAVALTALTLPLRLLSPPSSRLDQVKDTGQYRQVGQE